MKGRREEIWRYRRRSEGKKIGNKVYKRVYIYDMENWKEAQVKYLRCNINFLSSMNDFHAISIDARISSSDALSTTRYKE